MGSEVSNLIDFRTDNEDENLLIDKYNPICLPYRVRYLSTNDQFRCSRDLFLRSLFDRLLTKTFSDDETHFLSRATDDYDILVVGGNDPTRMGRFLRANRPLLNTVVKIAIMQNSTPPRRARLLNYGFDDVLDSAKMSTNEARARMISISGHYELFRNALNSFHEKKTLVAHICNPSDLTTREFDVLFILSRSAGAAVSTRHLCREIDPVDHGKFKRSVQVIISNIRRKIRPQFRIEANYQGGYRLYKVDMQSASA